MPANIEIKARLEDWKNTQAKVEALSDSQCEMIEQEDVFFNAPKGRLKLRLFENGSADLIQYCREDSKGAKQSTYSIYKTTQPDNLKKILSDSLGVRITVKKNRFLYRIGQTRIHLDKVDSLGNFIELEVVLKPGQPVSEGKAIAENLMKLLNINHNQLIDVAYADLLLKR